MKRIISNLLLSGSLLTAIVCSAATAAPTVADLATQCVTDLLAFPGPKTETLVKGACARVVHDPICVSSEGRQIYHYEKISKDPKAKKIMVFSLIHGDETPAGSVGRYWMERLETIDPRNSWRVVPVLNPDGVKLKTRTNANKIDINRNFPTKDWDELAVKLWKSKTNSNVRRFPGDVAGSEPETKCALKQLDDFKPDFVVSIHTPLKVLDFDGPKLKNPPKYDYLPWKSLGTFPGSLGRYMWFERNTPVLTMELKDSLPNTYQPFERLQDIIGTLTVFETAPRDSLKKEEAPPAPRAADAATDSGDGSSEH